MTVGDRELEIENETRRQTESWRGKMANRELQTEIERELETVNDGRRQTESQRW